MRNHPNRAPRSGHLPGHTRDTFLRAIEVFADSEPGAPLPLVPYEIQYRVRLISLAEAARLVSRCDDTLPGLAFERLRNCLRDPPADQSYGAGGRAMLAELRAAAVV